MKQLIGRISNLAGFSSWRTRKQANLWILSTLLIACFLWVCLLAASSNYVSDDTFIAFRYARNWVEYGLLTWNPAYEMVDGFTSFLHVLWLAIGSLLGFSLLTFQSYTSIFCVFAILVLMLLQMWKLNLRIGSMAVALLMIACYRPLAWYVTAGFETLPYTVIIMAALWLYLDTFNPHRWTPAALCIVLFALVLARPEGIAYAGFLGGGVLLRSWTEGMAAKRIFLYLLIAGTLLGSYLLIRTVVYGYPVPNTYFAKNAGGRIGRLLNGWEYIKDSLLWGGGCLIVIPFAGVLSFRSDFRLQALCLFAIAYFAIFTIAGGDNHPVFRFFVPLMPLLIILTLALSSKGGRIGQMVSVALGSFYLFGQIFGPVELRDRYRSFTPDGAAIIKHVRHGIVNIKEKQWPITENKFRSARKQTGESVNAIFPLETKVAAGDVGQIGYYMNQPIMDYFGLNDKKIAHLPAESFGRWHTYGKLSPQLAIDRNADLIIDNATAGQPVTDWQADNMRDAFKTNKFFDRYKSVNIAVPEEGRYVNAYIKKDSPVLNRLHLEYWSILSIVTALFPEEPKVYFESQEYPTLFQFRLSSVASIVTTGFETVDFAIVAQSDESTLKALLDNPEFQQVPQLVVQRNDWLKCFVRTSSIQRQFFENYSTSDYTYIPLDALDSQEAKHAMLEYDNRLYNLSECALFQNVAGNKIKPLIIIPASGLSGELKIRSNGQTIIKVIPERILSLNESSVIDGTKMVTFANSNYHYYKSLAFYGKHSTSWYYFDYNGKINTIWMLVRSGGNAHPSPAKIRLSLNSYAETIETGESRWVQIPILPQLGRNCLRIDVLSSDMADSSGSVFVSKIVFSKRHTD